MELLFFAAVAAVVLVAFRNFVGEQGRVADAQIDAGDTGGCLLTSAGVLAAFIALLVFALVCVAVYQGG